MLTCYIVLLEKLLVLTTTVLSQKEENLPWNLLFNLRCHPRRDYKKMKEPLSVLVMLNSFFLHVNHLAEFVVMSKIGNIGSFRNLKKKSFQVIVFDYRP